MIIGDLALYGGIVGIIIYVCVLVIRSTTKIGMLKDRVHKLEERIQTLTARRTELRAQHKEISPQVDALLKQLLELREARDKLQIQYEDLKAAAAERKIEIKSARSQ